MLMLWWLTGAAVLLACVALWTARRTARRLDQLTHAYWELRYQFTRLRSAAPGGDEGDGPARVAPPAAAAEAQASFISLASLRTEGARQPDPAAKAGDAGE